MRLLGVFSLLIGQRGTHRPISGRVLCREATGLDIIYEDDDVLAVNKPAGMVVQHGSRALADLVAAYLVASQDQTQTQREDDPIWPWKQPGIFGGIVHRLDRGTSGVIVMGKHPKAAVELRACFEQHRARKTYLSMS